MTLTPKERNAFLDRFEGGPALLRQAWEAVPSQARQWRPAEGRWSAHEVVVHCADSEAYAEHLEVHAAQIRRNLAAWEA
jgi:hypothetical protein